MLQHNKERNSQPVLVPLVHDPRVPIQSADFDLCFGQLLSSCCFLGESVLGLGEAAAEPPKISTSSSVLAVFY